MTRVKSEEVASPRELQRNSKGNISLARKKALQLVDKALESHIMGLAECQNLVTAVGKALQVEDADILKLRKHRVHRSVDMIPAKDGSSSSRKGGRSNSIDDHNEICEVCDKGGDLLCCDTCTLVFHLKCIRPKLTMVPKGHWSCPHCIIDDLADGDVSGAKRAIRSMRRLGRGIDSDDESSFTGAAPTEGVEAMRLNDVGSYSIVRKGRKFVLRRMERKQMVDVGKYLSLEEALNYIKEEKYHQQKREEEEQREKALEKGKPGRRGADHKEGSRSKAQTTQPFSSAVGITASSSTTSLSSLNRRATRHNSGGAGREREGDPSGSTAGTQDSAASEKDDGVPAGGDAAQAEDGGDASSSSSQSYDELWCTHCLDDRDVTVCAFCGCKKCFGKYDSNLLILCDHCDRETHTYCLNPPLATVPETDPWYCQSCTADGLPFAEPTEDGEDDDGVDTLDTPGDAGVGLSEPDGEDGGNVRKRRRGRPPSSSVSIVRGDGGAEDAMKGEAREIITYKKWGRGFKKIRTIVYGDAAAAAALAAGADDTKKGVRGKGFSATASSTSLTSNATAAANAALAVQQTPFPVHRGRGRPPGSGKRPTSVPSGIFAAAAGGVAPDLPPPPPLPPALARSGSKFSSQGSLMEAYSARPTLGKDKLAPMLKARSRTWSLSGTDLERPDGSRRSSSLSLGRDDPVSGVSPRSRPSVSNGSESGAIQSEASDSRLVGTSSNANPGDDAAMDVEGAEDAIEVGQQEEEEEEEEDYAPGAVGLPSALKVIERATVATDKVDGGPWTEAELDLLEQVRHWGAVQDLQKAHEALAAQKDLLIKRITALDALFDARDFEDAVQTEIATLAAAAAAADHAALSAASGPGGAVAGDPTGAIGGTTVGLGAGSVTSSATAGSAKKRPSKSAKAAAAGAKLAGAGGAGVKKAAKLPGSAGSANTGTTAGAAPSNIALTPSQIEESLPELAGAAVSML